MLIQLRHPISRLEVHEVIEDAKRVVGASVENISTVSELSCAQCQKAIPEKPYWCCLDCIGAFGIPQNLISTNASVDVYICISCNSDDEAKKPWLLQRVADPPTDVPHNVLHRLALANDSSVSSETELTTDHRLDRLEKKFEELRDRFESHEKVMQGRMEEVSRLLHQVLAHKVQGSSGSS